MQPHFTPDFTLNLVNVPTTPPKSSVKSDANWDGILQAIQENPEIAVDIMQSLSMKLLSSVEQIRCREVLSVWQDVILDGIPSTALSDRPCPWMIYLIRQFSPN